MRQRQRQDAILAFGGHHVIDKGPHHRPLRRIHRDHPAIEIAHHRAGPAGGGIERQGKEVMRALGNVGMRVFLKTDDQVGGGQHGGRQVAMRVDLERDDRIVAQDVAGPRHQIALAIVIPIGDHRAVHRQHDDIGPLTGDIGQDGIAELFISGAADQARGLRPGGQAVDNLPALRLARLPPDMQRHGAGYGRNRSRRGRDQLGREGLPPGRDRREGVGFVRKGGQEHFHALSPCQNRLARWASTWTRIRPKPIGMAIAKTDIGTSTVSASCLALRAI